MWASTVLYAGLLIALVGSIALVKPLRRFRIRTRPQAGVIAGLGLALIAVGLTFPAPERRVARSITRLDEFAPAWQFSELHTIHVRASPDRVFQSIKDVAVEEIQFFRTLTWIRRLGRAGPESILNAPERRPILDVALRGGFVGLADEPPRELVVGTIVMAPPSTRRAQIRMPDIFRKPDRPGLALAVMNFLVKPDGRGGTDLSTETRVYATSCDARRRFAVYWRVIYPGSAIIRRMWLRAIRARAEAAP